MSTNIESATLQRLAEMRGALVARVADQLTAALPPISPSQYDTAREALHHQRMLSTVARFHDMVLVAASTDWGMVTFEYDWASRVLLPLGITWEHQDQLIRAYFAAALSLAGWSHEARAVLAVIEQQLRAASAPAYVKSNPV